MKERGILFQAPLVCAILAGTKTQTRRLATPNQPIPESLAPFEMRRDPVFGSWMLGPAGLEMVSFFQAAHGWSNRAFGTCRYGAPGDRLWVRETWRCVEREEDGVDGIRYLADDAFLPIKNSRASAEDWLAAFDNGRHGESWRPIIFMPRWASRITLEVTEVRVERLQTMGDADARAEGFEHDDLSRGTTACSARDRFAIKWDEINGKRASWDSNPWVWCISFKVCR